MKNSKSYRAIHILASAKFFWFVIGFFVIESLWVALTTVYPMAFDEDFHFGLIKIYSHHILPFFTRQPSDANFYGPVGQNPSYLYHYLMSFPYRLIALFVHSQTLQIVLLRLLNIALFAFSMILFRRVFLLAKLSQAFTNFVFLLFVLVPIVPVLAGQINYDNLTMVLVAWVCLLMFTAIHSLKKHSMPAAAIMLLASVTLLGSIVKYAFLPVMAACAIVIVILIFDTFGFNLSSIWKSFHHSLGRLSPIKSFAAVFLLLISLGLFSQRYLVNIAEYKSPIPRCDKVLTVDECMAYGPFSRTYTLALTKDPTFKPNISKYAPLWLYGMWFRTFFAVNGNIAYPSWARYETIPPLKFPSITFVGLIIASIGVVSVYIKKLYRDKFLIFLAVMAAFYTTALFLENYGGYAHSGQPLAINGRYLLPMALPVLIIVGRAWQLALSDHSATLKLGLATVTFLLLIQGGGVLTLMINSNYTWYWPDHRTQSAGYYAHEIAQHIVIDDSPMYILPP